MLGSRIGCVCTPSPRKVPPNHGAVLQKPGEAKKLVDKEVKLGRVLGPFKQPPVNSLICSPLNLIPKVGNPGIYHLIHNLAFPYDSNNINGNIPDSQAVVTYAPFDQAVCNPKHHIKLSAGAIKDLKMWFQFLTNQESEIIVKNREVPFLHFMNSPHRPEL